MQKVVLLVLLVWSGYCQSMDTLVIRQQSTLLNKSIANYLHLYRSCEGATIHDFVQHPEKYEKIKLQYAVENLDFTSCTYFIDFTLSNTSNKDLQLLLQTARPISNRVDLLQVDQKQLFRSGDGIPFRDKIIKSNQSILPITLKKNQTEHFVLHLESDGEIISLPFILWEPDKFHAQVRQQQLLSGLYYGIFLFVLIIYSLFYIQLKDSLFLFYSLYVLFSALLQFALDGYFHEYIFQSGGYPTQHVVILVAGATVLFALKYASAYLQLGRKTRLLEIAIITCMGASLIPGKLYELSYPLINGFSLLVIFYLLYQAIRTRINKKEASMWFISGMTILLASALIFILGNFSIIDQPEITQHALKAGSLAEIICLSLLMAIKYRSLFEEKEKAQRELLKEMHAKNLFISESNSRLEVEVAERTKELNEQGIILKQKNDDLMASIAYAERIQHVLLSNERKFKSLFHDSFILFLPRDVVSGDFFQVETQEDERFIYVAVADCTGHGVPGAFVSIICNSILNRSFAELPGAHPGEILNFISREINTVLNPDHSEIHIRDGMDIALLTFDTLTQKLYFSGGRMNLIAINEEGLVEYKAERIAIGEGHEGQSYSTTEIPFTTGTMFYAMSDGFVDQFGGEFGKKYTKKRMMELLSSVHHLSTEAQKKLIQSAYINWKKDFEQTDDVLVVGIRLGG